MREPEAPTHERERSHAARNADARGEEFEDDQRKAGDEQEVGDPRRAERVRELLSQIELVEPDILIQAAVPGRTTQRRELHGTVRGRNRATVQ